MKTGRRHSEKDLIKTTQLRRNAMNATKLALIALSATTLILAGCSGDRRITAPGDAQVPDIDKDLAETVTPMETENNATMVAVGNNGSTMEHLSIVAKVLRTDVENGCWYLKSENGENYTPVTPKSLSLESGMKLAASGYIDKNIHFFCGNGPAFVIKEYKILGKSNSSNEDRSYLSAIQMTDTPTEDRAPQPATKEDKKKKLEEKGISKVITEDRAPVSNSQLFDAQTEDRAAQSAITEYKKKKLEEEGALKAISEDRAFANDSQLFDVPTEDRAPRKYVAKTKIQEPRFALSKPVPIIYNDTELNSYQATKSLKGYVEHTKQGCLLLVAGRKDVFELQHDMDVVLEDGTYIHVTGYIRTLLYASCSNGPVFYADRLEILSNVEEPKKTTYEVISPREDTYDSNVIEAEGTMHATEPEGMCWYFETDEWERYELIFRTPINLRSGMRLIIRGKPASVSTFCAAGKPLEVIGWQIVNENKF
jgi:hypothetical protein